MTPNRHMILIVEFAAAAQLGALLREAGMDTTVVAGHSMPVMLREVMDEPVITLSLPARDEVSDVPHLKAVPPQMMPIKTYRAPRQRFDRSLKIKR